MSTGKPFRNTKSSKCLKTWRSVNQQSSCYNTYINVCSTRCLTSMWQLPDPFLQNLDPVINLVNLQLNSLVSIAIIFCKNIQIIQFRTQLIFQVLLAVQFFSGSFLVLFWFFSDPLHRHPMVSFCKIFYVSFTDLLALFYFLY